MSCRNSTNNTLIKKIEIKNTEVKTTIKLSDLKLTDIIYIPLETKPESLIPKILKIFSDGNDYYIRTYTRVIKFDSKGKFSSSIGKKGRGPEEYLYCNDFSINSNNKAVYILSAMQDKIFVYTNQGNFMKTLKTSREITDITCFKGGVLCHSCNVDSTIKYSFEIIDYKGKDIKAFPNKYKLNNINNGSLFTNEFLSYKWNDSIFTKEMYSDTIFLFKDMRFTPTIILDSGGKRMSASAKEKILDIDDLFKIKSRYIIDYELLRFGGYLYLVFGYNNERYILIVSLNDNTQYLSLFEDGIINDIDGGLNFYPKTILDNNTIIGWISPLELKARVSSDAFKNSTPKYPEKKKELEKLANSLDETDNPVLMLVKLKDD